MPSVLDWLTDNGPISPREKQVRVAQVKQLYSQAATGHVGSAFLAAVLVAALWNSVSNRLLIAWLVCYGLIQAYRLKQVSAFHRFPQTEDAIFAWGLRAHVLNAVAGMAWGMIPIVLFPIDSPAHQYLITLFMTGLTCAMVVVYAPSVSAYLPGVLFILLPLAGRFLYEGGNTHFACASVVLGLVVVILLTARRIHDVNVGSLRLRFEKDDLIESLAEEKTRAERLNDHLRAEITERERAEERIKASLAEKEALLRETHHRVKNNFAIMCSLLRLQSKRVSDEGLLTILNETEFRVRCMSMVHERLHQSESLTDLKISDYLEGLVRNLMEVYGAVQRKISVNTRFEKVALRVDTALPLGFVTSELVSNALKHAFPDGRPGEIGVSLSSIDAGEYELVVQDNGVGMPNGTGFAESNTLGLDLVRTFSKQLNGELRITTGSGTHVRIRFKEVPRRREQ